MTITLSIDHVVDTTEAYNSDSTDKDIMLRQSTVTDPKTGEVTTVYVIPGGSQRFPASVSYISGIRKNGTGERRHVAVIFQTWALMADDSDGSEVRFPIQGSVSLEVPLGLDVELADVDSFLGAVFSYTFKEVSGGFRDTDWLSALLYGITEVK